ncbi:MAG TPA: DMT family transporter [Planctomycetota bacterium]|jgi:drug/metabolite transporter (DMT)-like permease|nr:DMT family transporter [Planctomycetota bacterium]
MSPSRRATLLLVATTVLWGSSFLTMDWGTRGIALRLGSAAAPSAFLFLRFLASAVLQVAVFPSLLKDLTVPVVRAGAILSLPFYAGFLLQATGLGSSTSTVVAFLTSLFVVITPLIGRLFFRESIALSTLVGAVVSLGGVYVMTDPSVGLGRGELLSIACAVAFAFQIQMTNVITRSHRPEAISLVQFSCAVIYSGITMAVMGVNPGDLIRSMGERHVAWTVLYAASACSVIAMGVLNRFQRDISATRASVIYMIEPVIAALLAALVAGEAMTTRKVVGGAVILLGNLACELMGRRAPEERTA